MGSEREGSLGSRASVPGLALDSLLQALKSCILEGYPLPLSSSLQRVLDLQRALRWGLCLGWPRTGTSTSHFVTIRMIGEGEDGKCVFMLDKD